jgi:hypothetical protein
VGVKSSSLTLRQDPRVCENRVLNRLFGFKKEKTILGRRKLHNEDNLYSSPNIIRIMESRRMRWTGHVPKMGSRGMHTGFWCGSEKERGH